MSEREQKRRMRRVIARGWFSNSRPQESVGCELLVVRSGLASEDYPADWPEIAARIKLAAGGCCERCKHPHDVASGHVLTVHHLDGCKANCADWNLAALCQRCHLSIQGRVKMDQLFFTGIIDVSDWYKPHLEGYLRSKSPTRNPQP